jgi:hypothetical protein
LNSFIRIQRLLFLPFWFSLAVKWLRNFWRLVKVERCPLLRQRLYHTYLLTVNCRHMFQTWSLIGLSLHIFAFHNTRHIRCRPQLLSLRLGLSLDCLITIIAKLGHKVPKIGLLSFLRFWFLLWCHADWVLWILIVHQFISNYRVLLIIDQIEEHIVSEVLAWHLKLIISVWVPRLPHFVDEISPVAIHILNILQAYLISEDSLPFRFRSWLLSTSRMVLASIITTNFI